MYCRERWERLCKAWADGHAARLRNEPGGYEREWQARNDLRDALDREQLVAVGSMRQTRQVEHASA